MKSAGAAGKAAAEAVNPTAEEAHWRDNYTREPYYEQGRSYDDYGPAAERLQVPHPVHRQRRAGAPRSLPVPAPRVVGPIKRRHAVQVDWAFPIHGNLRGHAQIFHGYGESLIDYNFRSTRFGLGLSIVQRSAAVMGHALTLRSVPGRGTCFGLVVPQVTDHRRDVGPLAGLRAGLLAAQDAASFAAPQ